MHATLFRSAAVAAIMIVSALALTGCSGPAETYADLERPATPEDALPESVEDSGDTYTLNGDSARLVLDRGDKSLFVARGSQDGVEGICLVLTSNSGPEWGISCGVGAANHGDDKFTYFLLPDNAGPERMPQDIALTKISDNIYSSPVEPLGEVQ